MREKVNYLYITLTLFYIEVITLDNRNAIIAILIIIIVVVVAVFALNPGLTSGKTNTQINFLGGDTVQDGDKIEFELKDQQGTALANQNVTITYESQNFNVVTDSQGKAYLELVNQKPGEHTIKVTFNETDKYNGCTAEKTVKLEDDGTNETVPSSAKTTDSNSSSTSSSSSASSSNGATLYYDTELNVYYDSNGRVIGGQSDGAYIGDLRDFYESELEAQAETGRYGESI